MEIKTTEEILIENLIIDICLMTEKARDLKRYKRWVAVDDEISLLSQIHEVTLGNEEATKIIINRLKNLRVEK